MILPKQYTTLAEKLKKDDKGRMAIYDTIDYYIEEATHSNRTQEIYEIRDMIHGVIYENDYKRITNTYNRKTGTDGQEPSFNAKLRNHNILLGLINLLVGEFGRRAHEYEVIDFNPDDESAYKDALVVALRGYYQQEVINTLNNIGFPTGEESQELPTLEQYKENFKQSYDANLVLTGQEALDYIHFNQDLEDKYITAYWDWVAYGCVYTYKQVLNDDVIVQIVPADEMFVPYEKNNIYVEDRSYAVRKQIVTVSYMIDTFKDLDKSILEKLDSDARNYNMSGNSVVVPVGKGGLMREAPAYINGSNYNSILGTGNTVALYHVQFKTWVPIGILTYEDELGQVTTMQVDETYKLNEEQGDIDIEWIWENLVFQAWKYDNHYLNVGPLVENRAELNNTSIQKLSYNGREELSPSGGVASLIKEGMDYQRLINTVHYQAEKYINRHKGTMTVMPFGLIPKKQGMTAKDVMYHADATGILWIDETSPNASYAGQMIKSINTSDMNFVKECLEFIRETKGEYWESIGMTPQRYADIGTSAGKSTTEQAIVRSAIITAELTRRFEKVMEKDYEGVVDLSKLAWINGKKAKYIRSDGSQAVINLNADNVIHHLNRSYGVFVKNSTNNTEAITALRGLGQAMIQNGADVSIIPKLYSTNSTTRLSRIIEKQQELTRKFEEQMKATEAENQKQLQQMVNDNDADNREMEKYKIDSQLEGVKYTADRRAESGDSNEPQEARPANEIEMMLANHKVLDDTEKRRQKDEDLKLKNKQINKINNKTK